MGKKITTVKVRNLLNVTPQELLTGYKQNTTNVIFEDDVTLSLQDKELVILRYILELHRMVPEIPILSKHCFTNYYVNNTLTSKTINNSFEAILETIVNNYLKPNNIPRTFLNPIYKEFYNITNRIYNEVTYSILEHAKSISITDFLDIQMEEELLNALRQVNINKDVASVNNTYDVLDKLLRDPKFKHNTIAKGYIAGTINANQVKQLLGSRGYVTEIDSHIFKYPIASSFTLGMSNIYDLAIESRAGAKALFLSNTAVQQSEYFARELQLVAMIVERLVDTDCGSTNYLEWMVKGPDGDTGKSDIPNLVGKYYLNEDTNQLELITKNHTHLEGKTIKLRSGLNCTLKDPNCVCIKCFGDLAYTVPSHANIGHFSSVEVTQKLTQSILSTKHLATSASAGSLRLSKEADRFFYVKDQFPEDGKDNTPDNNYYLRDYLTKDTKNEYYLVVDQLGGFGIKDLNPRVDVTKFSPARMSRIANISIQARNGKTIEEVVINIKENKRYGHFTHEFLNYVKTYGYTLDTAEKFNINLKHWDTSLPIINIPDVEYNYLTLSDNVKKLFRGIKVKKNGTSNATPEELLQRLFDMVNFKLDVNLALLEIITYAYTVKSITNHDFNLGRNTPDRQLMDSRSVIFSRSHGAGYDWEAVNKAILSPKAYYGYNAVDHPMDVAIKPNENRYRVFGVE